MLTFKQFSHEYDLTVLESVFDGEFYEFVGAEGHSVQLDEKARSTSSGRQPWADKSAMPTAKSSEDEVRQFLQSKVIPVVKEAYKEYARGMKKVAQSAKNSKVLVDQKTPSSVLSKIKRGKDIGAIHDILRGAILTRDMDGVEAVRKAIKKTFRVFEEEVKEFGGDKKLGYFGSIHYKVELKNGTIAEIQLMPKSLWNMKAAAHKIYEPIRDKLAIDPNFSQTKEFQQLQKTSRDIFRRGAGNKGVRLDVGPNIKR